MAKNEKKNNKKGGLEVGTLGPAVPAQTLNFGGVLSDAASAVPALGSAVRQENISGGKQGIQQGLSFLTNQGIGLANPSQAAALALVQQNNAIPAETLARQAALPSIIEQTKSRIAAATGKPALLKQLNAKLKKLTSEQTKINKLVTTKTQNIETARTQLFEGKKTAGDIIREADPQTYQNIDRAQGVANTIGQTTPEGRRYLDSLARGYTASNIGSRDVTAAQVGQATTANAAQMGPIANVSAGRVTAPTMGNFGSANATSISAGQVGQGMLGQSLMQRAMEGIANGGRLNAQATRDAIQSARQGFAARGLAAGSSSLAAELLNRDRYSRVREFEDLGLAQQVQGQDLSRQFQNVGNQLTAAQANQSAALQAEIANLQARKDAAIQQGNWEQAAAFQNQEAALRADLANQQTALATGQFNTSELNKVGMFNAENADRLRMFDATESNRVGMFNSDTALRAAGMNEDAQRAGAVTNNEMLYNAAAYQDAMKAQGLGASLQMAGVQQAANPLFRAAGLDMYGTRGSGSQALGAATTLAGNVADANAQIGMFNAGQANQFAMANWNAQNWANSLKYMPSFNSGSSTGSMFGGLGGAALGAGLGALLAAPTGGMSITTGALLGAGIGGGAGAGVGGLLGR